MTRSLASAERSAPAPRHVAVSRPLVLLAEDDPAFRRLLQEALEEQGLEVLPTTDVGSLLDLLGSVALGLLPMPDLLLTDQRLPGGLGLEVLAELRRSGWDLPCVLITAFGDPALHARAEALGVISLDKPLDVDTLAAGLRAALRGQRAPGLVGRGEDLDWPFPAQLEPPLGEDR